MIFRRLFLSFFSNLAAGYALGQTAPSTADPGVVHLDALVVSAGPENRTVFDLAQGASALTGARLRSSEAATLGETLSGIPGISSTYYGPGASRPIIRGLGGDRVRMLDNGIGSLDASNVSPDHNTAIEPLLVDRIEVLRGPAALIYGSSAVGGVVNVVDNRIPSAPSSRPLDGRGELRFGSAADERTGVFALNGGTSHFGFAVQGLRTETGDVSIPGLAQSGPEAPPDQVRGILPGSAISTRSGAAGGSYFWSGGFVGASLSEFDTRYGVPSGDTPSTSIDLQQRRIDLRGETTRPFSVFKGARVRFGLADYRHAELTGPSQINTTFKNRAWEGRVELLQQNLGRTSGLIGLQLSRSDFSAVGEEVVTPASVTGSSALFASEELSLSKAFRLVYGGRFERQTIRLGEVGPDLPAFPGWHARTGGRREQNTGSVSAGFVWYPAVHYSVAFSLARTGRPPTSQELFSNGPHGGTGAYEVGGADLGQERSTGVDLTLRKRAGRVTGEAGVFVNRFSGYVFENVLAETVENKNNPDDLRTFQYVARDALFLGGELGLTLHLIDSEAGRLHLEVSGDYVRAQDTTSHQPLPRIPPLRLGTSLHWSRGPWSGSVEARHVFSQRRISALETETGGYTLLGAELGYNFKGWGQTCEIFVRGSNLSDVEARVHTSFLKDYAPLPGRNFTFGLSTAF